MLRPQQVRQLVTLASCFLVGIILLALTPQLQEVIARFRRTGPPPPPPSLELAPSPPAPPAGTGGVVLHGALRDVADGLPLDVVDKDPAYRRLVAYVARVTPQGLHQSSEGELAYATYVKYAPELRGRIFRVRGKAAGLLQAVRLDEPAEGREDVYRLFMVDEGVDAGFVCDLVDNPPEVPGTYDTIEVEGLFYGICRFESKRKVIREVPLLVARSFSRYQPVTGSAPDPIFWYKVVLAVAILGMLVGAYFLLRNLGRTRSTPVRPGRAGGGPRGLPRSGPGPRPPAGGGPPAGPDPAAGPPGSPGG